MSLYSYSTILSPSSSITTVSNPSDNEQRTLMTTDDEQWSKERIIQDHWRIEKNVNMKKPKSNSCILKVTMTKEQILIHDSSSSQSMIVLPGKHVSMKVVFHF